MRLNPHSGLLLGLLAFAGLSGCSANAKHEADAALPAIKAVAPKLPESAPPAEAANVAEPLDEEVRKPATAAEAAQAIDLSTFPLLPGVEEIETRAVARLDYGARLKTFDVKNEYEFQRRNLLERQWKELSPSQISAGYAEGQFGRLGFRLYVTVQFHDEPGKVWVRLENNSNVNVSKLPVPPGATFRDASYNMASFETTAGVEETREAVRELLLEQGWQPLGMRGNSLDLKQNCVALNAHVVAPSAQPGKTRIVYSTIQMSADLPVPADADSIEYDVEDTQLKFIAKKGPEEVADYYHAALAPAQWKATTERLIKDGVESFIIFRNPANDLLRLDMRESRSKQHTRVRLKHQSAAEVEETERRTKGPDLERN